MRSAVIAAMVAAGFIVTQAFAYGDVAPAASTDAAQRVRWAPAPVPLPEFRLTDEHGRVGLPELRGRTALLFFGFTNCQNVCPATLQVLDQAGTALDRRGAGATRQRVRQRR